MSVGEGEKLTPAPAGGLPTARHSLAAILGAVTDAITVQDGSGRLIFANDAAARLVGFETAAELLAASVPELIGRFELLDELRRPLPLEALPGRIALAERREESRTLCYRLRDTGEERWSQIRSLPLEADDGTALAVNVIRDVTEQRRSEEQLLLLSAASELLVSSLDYEATVGAIGALLVPSFADYCLVDLVEADGSLRLVVLRHADPLREEILRKVRRRYPPQHNPAHPASLVLRSGEPLLIEIADEPTLADAALDEHHLTLYRALDPSSYLVVPLIARGRTLGTLSLGMGDSGRRYRESHVAFSQQVAERIALAVDNARLYTEAGESLALLDTLLLSSPVGIGFWDRELRYVRVNDALAAINGLPPEQHLGRTLADVLPGLAPVLEPLYRRVLETGEPIIHQESTDATASDIGDRRHWLSSYYPVRTEAGETIGVGAVIMEVTGQRRADDRLRLLAEAGELFASSLVREEIFERVARVIVPRLADSCNIYLADGDELRRVALTHANPELEPLVGSLPEAYSLGEDSTAAMARVYRRGQAVLMPTLDAAFIENLERLGVEREAFERIGTRSMMIVPLVVRGQSLGVITISSRTAGRYDEADLELAKELARRAAAAVENARLFHEVSFRTTLLEAQQEAAIDGLLLVSPDGRLLSNNRRFAELWGFPNEIVARSSDEDALARAMELVADPQAFFARVQHLYAHPEETSREEIELKDGRVFDRYGAAVRSPEGEYYGWLWSFRDVTEPKRGEIALRVAQERLAAAVSAAGVGTWVWDVPGGRIVADEWLAHVFGLDPAEAAAGAPLDRFLAGIEDKDRPRVAEGIRHALEEGGEYEAEYRVWGADRVVRWVLARGFVEHDSDGQPIRFPGAISEITERKRVERALRDAQTTLEAAAAAARVGTWYWDVGANVTVADEFISHAFGVDPALGAAGAPPDVWLAAINDEDRARVEQALAGAVESTGEYSEEFRVTGLDGLERWVLSRGVVETDAPGGGARILGAVADLTERKRAERELTRRAEAAQALEFVGDAVFLLDGDGIVRLWNPAAAALTGLREADVVGRRLEQTIPGWADVERLVPVSETRHGGGVRAETVPVEIEGQELWLSISGVAFDEGTVYAFRDLTEERAIERLKSDFVSTISHELRTPLAAIYGAAMTLQREDVVLSTGQRDSMLGVVAGESERLARIVNDILLASRLDSDVVEVSIGRADAAEIALAVIAAAQAHLPPEIEISLVGNDDLPPISADGDKVRQVLVNLVENAIKYSPDGGPVEVGFQPVHGWMRVSVRDEGLGIPAAEHGRIFEKFYRLDPNLTRGVGGTGLGLYICREIVRRMGGRIWVDSDPGYGSTFTFELPLAD